MIDKSIYFQTRTAEKVAPGIIPETNPILEDGFPLRLEISDKYIMSLNHTREEMAEMYKRRGLKYDRVKKRD